MEASVGWGGGGFEPTGLTPSVNVKPYRLCEPENNLRTRYIQNPPGPNPFDEAASQHSKARRLENIASTSLSAYVFVSKRTA